MTKKSKPPSKKKPFDDYIRYSGIAFQMLGIILLGWFIGSRLDKWIDTETESPIFTAISLLVFVIIAIVIVIRQLLNN